METVNLSIGERIRTLRESKLISLQEMAERTSLSEVQIEKIEQAKELPSLTPLVKIARVLGVRLGTFLDDHDEEGPIITRRDTHTKSVSFSTSDTLAHRHMDYFALSSSKAGRHMEPFIIKIEPVPEGVDFIVSSHEGEEFVYCLEGSVEINYGKETYLLKEGDSIYYDSIVAHHVRAGNQQKAKILAVIYMPF
ncbi:MAG: XRE family transcriptional regulator [Bacteroidales bacterium]|jgi:transcriptional regulator with XRE-family HTH domain|nr:XRE family transcriptional regulator [Bacteroidales bacterium]